MNQIQNVSIYILPLLDGLPRDDKTKLRLYERLLEGSMLGGQMAGGGVGVAVKEELIFLIHCTIDMEHAVSSALRAFAPLYVETVEKWRKICTEISEGRDDAAKSEAGRPPQQMPGGMGQHGGKPGQGFIKI